MTLDGEPLVFSIIVERLPRALVTHRGGHGRSLVRLVKFPRELHEE
jgi:hypothetical protein